MLIKYVLSEFQDTFRYVVVCEIIHQTYLRQYSNDGNHLLLYLLFLSVNFYSVYVYVMNKNSVSYS